MKVLFRTDASVEIGTGHLMRCLTLAKQLAAKGAEITFTSKLMPEAMTSMIKKERFQYKNLRYSGSIQNEIDAELTARTITSHTMELDLVVVDHYNLDARWEQKLRPHTKKIMVIDDLANRPHDCDVLLDQNYYENLDTRYQGLIPETCETFLGPAHVLFRDEFYETATKSVARSAPIKKILVFFGGADHTNQTSEVVKAIKLLNRKDITFNVVVGSAYPFKEQLEQLIHDEDNINYFCQISNMAEVILNSDLAIGAGGASMWERCFLGLPTITVAFAHNQIETSVAAFKAGVIEYLGHVNHLKVKDYLSKLNELIDNPTKLNSISKKAMGLLQPTQESVVNYLIKQM